MAAETASYPHPLNTLEPSAIGPAKSAAVDMEPCYFPTLNDGIVLDGGPQRVPLNLDADRISEFCERTKIPVTSLVQAAWILMLRLYTGADRSCFGCLPSDGEDVNMLLCYVAPGAASVEELLRGLRFHPVEYAEQNENVEPRKLFNTVMSIRAHAAEAAHDEDSTMVSTLPHQALAASLR